MNFQEIRDLYVQEKDKERLKIVKHLQEEGNFSKINKRGKGRKSYTSGKRIAPYDLSWWQYIEADYKDLRVFISFQPFDIDPSSKNIHILEDRIGLYFYPKYLSLEQVNKIYPILENNFITNFSLPLDKSNLIELIDTIKQKYSYYRCKFWGDNIPIKQEEESVEK